ncbi:MAG: MbtH family NRPS accessory protein, partial [Richelia sp. RM2_1_2]|nr:MbtH family NRPS accessory protein [Richelia sp. RM2_1_2]
WPSERDNPLGWKDAGKNGLKQECLDYIKEVWTDMRPLSLRKKWRKQHLALRFPVFFTNSQHNSSQPSILRKIGSRE